MLQRTYDTREAQDRRFFKGAIVTERKICLVFLQLQALGDGLVF